MAKGGKANILVAAYSDLNGNGKFDNKELIASVVDTNHDNTFNIGDTVNFGTYPLHVDGTGGRGTFTQTTATVTGVTFVLPGAVEVQTASGLVDFAGFTGTQAFTTDSEGTKVLMQDRDFSGDQLFVSATGGPGAPDTFVNEGALHPGDQPFLDLFFII